MANEVEKQLNDELLSLLKKERFVTVATIDHESNAPNVNAISWIYAPNSETIRFSIDSRSRTIQDIRVCNKITVNVIGNGSIYAISGEATILQDTMKDIPLKLSLVEIHISEVRDVMFYGSKISVDPQYEKTYDAAAAEKLDSQVLKALKED